MDIETKNNNDCEWKFDYKIESDDATTKFS